MDRRPQKSSLPNFIDFPFLIAALLTTGFYVVLHQPFAAGSLLHRYTAEHLLQHVVVGFFLWGLVDAIWRGMLLPREVLALRQEWLPQRVLKDSVSRSADFLQALSAKPLWQQNTRLGQRFQHALQYLEEKQSADGFDEHLQYLAIQDDDRTYANFALLRFVCWVAPVLGILGTVIHFGSAFGGLSAEELGGGLEKVLGEVGNAFNTTTVALAAAIISMFALYFFERTERGVVHAIDRRVNLELLNRFEVHDENLTPFLSAVHASSQAGIDALDQTVERQMQIWTTAFQQLQQQSEQRLQTHAQSWEQSLATMHHHFESSDAEREKRLTRVLSELQVQRSEQKTATEGILAQAAALHRQFSQLVESMTGLHRDSGQLSKLQHSLSENLRIIQETQHLDQAVHGLTAAIHLLTARHEPAKLNRAA
ncbi:MAG: MotA/TolQ/ExbB proton channel family protein [Pirellulales bacterium]|nr:MotA/TolQ/ExbB proton channel family protein [Pirellulales bacterium]